MPSRQKHDLDLMTSEHKARSRAAFERLLRTERVKLPSEDDIQARLYAMIEDEPARARLEVGILPRLSKLAGRQCTLSALLVACFEPKSRAGDAHAAIASGAHASVLRLAAGILDDPSAVNDALRMTVMMNGASRAHVRLVEEE